VRRHAARQQPAHFVHDAARELLVDAARHARAVSSAGAAAIAVTSQSSMSDRVPAKCAVSGVPVAKYTSSARTIRLRSRAMMRAPDADRRAQHAVQPFGPAPGRDAIETIAQRLVGARARKQAAHERAVVEPVPPTRIGRRPRAWTSRMTAAASRANCAAVYTSVGSAMSMRWCADALPVRGRHLVGPDVEARGRPPSSRS
jgi:hypothetical protein